MPISKYLELEYTPASLVPDIQIYLDSYSHRGELARNKVAHQKIQYGDHQDEWLWYAACANSNRLIVFVHGGFWRRLSGDDGTFLTPAWHNYGYNVASINYSLCPHAKLDVLVDQTIRAIRFLALGHEPSTIILVGHSAGAHLIAMAMCHELAPKFLGAVLVSGVFDLEPIINTSINDSLMLNRESAYTLSPINHLENAKDTPVAVIWGEIETSEFKRQSSEFAKRWSQLHSSATTIEFANRNHFDVLDELMTRNVLDLTSE